MASLTPMVEPQSLPLADYFFICGIETSKIFASGKNGNTTSGPASPVLGGTIEEGLAYDGSPDNRPTSRGSPTVAGKRRARFSYEAGKSVSSVINLDSQPTHSNRSSATAKGGSTENGINKDDEGFIQALHIFDSDREAFLSDVNAATLFSSGQLAQPSRPRPKAKTQRIVGDERTADRGNIRRRISTMNPLSRQTTTSKRLSARQSKRISGYNAVTPLPKQFKVSPDDHPLMRPYEPVLLDKYPSLDDSEHKRRNRFPDFVPMFVFPNDIRIVSSDQRPRSTWHGFVMTGADNAKQYGMCLISWMSLPEGESDELERQCDEWRNGHMSREEREMAKDLSERLALMRAKLSDLLAELPELPYGTPDRDKLEEEIGEVEERISLMAEALRPVRHAGASKIDGLTDGQSSGFWIPRAYGIMGRDEGLTSFWKDWLRAIAIPITQGTLLNIPPSSPHTGIWQPLERYVVNMCTEAPSPLSSKVQVQLTIRDLNMFARKEAENEIPNSRNTDLYPLFRCLSLPDIVILFEYVLTESRIILYSSHTSMLYLVAAAIKQLLWPLTWHGAFVPVLPARLVQMLDAPCPYIFGIERRYENIELPEDDFVLVDLDNGTIDATAPPVSLPRQQRRKLLSILQLAAPHHNRFGVPAGPPEYAINAYPGHTFPSENPTNFEQSAPRSSLSYLANLSSGAFGLTARATKPRPPCLNVFLHTPVAKRKQSFERPPTSATFRTGSPPSPGVSPTTSTFPRNMANGTFVSRNDSAYALQTSLREKRSGKPEPQPPRRNSTFGLSGLRRPSLGFANHQSTTSISTVGTDAGYSAGPAMSTYAPSVYAPSTMAASTIMPSALMHPVRNTQNQMWQEGHCMQLKPPDGGKSTCSVCDNRTQDLLYRCSGCGLQAHGDCTDTICLVCPAAFFPEQIQAAFARCFASLFYTYRKSLSPASSEQKKKGQLFHFKRDQFVKNQPNENADYITMLLDTQAFNEFIHDATTLPQSHPSIRLFDSIIGAKRARGRPHFFGRSSSTPNPGHNPSSRQSGGYLADKTEHLWATAAAPAPKSAANDYSGGEKRYLPGKLDPALMSAPRVVQGVPQVKKGRTGIGRKAVPSMMNPDLHLTQTVSGEQQNGQKGGSRLRD